MAQIGPIQRARARARAPLVVSLVFVLSLALVLVFAGLPRPVLVLPCWPPHRLAVPTRRLRLAGSYACARQSARAGTANPLMLLTVLSLVSHASHIHPTSAQSSRPAGCAAPLPCPTHVPALARSQIQREIKPTTDGPTSAISGPGCAGC